MRRIRTPRSAGNGLPSKGRQLSLPLQDFLHPRLGNELRQRPMLRPAPTDTSSLETATNPLPSFEGARIAPSPAGLIAALVRAKDPSPVLLLGAGCSHTSGVPATGAAVEQIAREAYLRRLGGRLSNPSADEIQNWLENQSWFVPGEGNREENFPLAVKHLLTPADFKRRVLCKLVEVPNDLSSGYEALGRLWQDAHFGTILTTNFDRCLVRAFRSSRAGETLREVNRRDGDFAQFEPHSAHRQLIWLHGNVEHYSARTTPDEISELSQDFVAKLRPLIDYAPLIVIGYRGAEASIMHHLLLDKNRGEYNYPKGIYWCILRGTTVHPNVTKLAAAIGDNFHLLEIDGFDELMVDLGKEFPHSPSIGGFDGMLCRRVALASLIVKELRSDPNLGRTKLAKIFYVSDMLANLDLGTQYSRARNGPLDQRALYNEKIGIEALGSSYDLFSTSKIGGQIRYRLTNIERVDQFIERHLRGSARDIAALIQKLAPMTLSQAEIVATLFACWNELLNEQHPPSDEAIIASFYGWSREKERFNKQNLQRALDWMRHQNLVPQAEEKSSGRKRRLCF